MSFAPSRRSLLLAAGLTLPAGLAGAQSLDAIRQRGTLRIVTTSASPPHGFLDPTSNTLRGIMFEVGESVARRIGVRATFSEVPFGSLIGEITSGRADLMSAPLFITPARAEVLDFSIPIYGWGEGFVTRGNNTRAYPDLNALSGQNVGAQVGTVQLEMLRAVPGIREVRTYPDAPTMLLDLRAGRIDVALIDPPSIAYQLRARRLTDLRLVEGYRPVNRWQIGMAVAKGNATLLAAVNTAVAALKADGELLRILTSWDIPDTLIP
ncbi:ABC transporter substrate-binding protein [Sediminicoccus rosea]|uniref:ABC transporter substrate-binding protein n=1 Tax=Sediminicoccus rosea TaxID=1225128 RepID=A0ABZ0PM64_9PROT|nr:ABC transporter substrate-binding protein [Sediminicoccus rosea]WPB86824.1 ABC transporter substrate-binding protein [Sediminicoccus rosea]